MKLTHNIMQTYNRLSKVKKIIFILLLTVMFFYVMLIMLKPMIGKKADVAIYLLPVVITLILLVLTLGKLVIRPVATPLTLSKGAVCKHLAVCIIPMLVVWAATFPGLESTDTISQWKQVQTFQFNDWHPVAHTFLIWFSTIFIREYWFALLVQDIALGMAAAYMSITFVKWNIPKWYRYIAVMMVVLNPATWGIVPYLWKDVAFGIFALLLITQCVNIFLSHGDWLKEWKHITYFTLTWVGTSLMRHNGIFLTGTILCLLLFIYRDRLKKILLLIVSCLLTLVIIKGPIYHMLDTGSGKNQTYVESVGIPMTILGAAITTHPERLSEETKTFLYQIAPQEKWDEHYVLGNWNSMKFKYPDEEIIIKISPIKLLGMTFEAIKAAPRSTLDAVLTLTEVVWNPIVDPTWALDSRKYKGLDPLIWCTGTYMFTCILLGLLKIRWLKKDVLLLVLPMFAYNIGTMLMLCGTDWRFFYYNTLIFIPIICMFLVNDKVKISTEKIQEMQETSVC